MGGWMGGRMGGLGSTEAFICGIFGIPAVRIIIGLMGTPRTGGAGAAIGTPPTGSFLPNSS